MHHEKYGSVKFSEGLGIFDQHYGYPLIDNQEIYDGPTGKVIDIQGIQAHAGKDFFVPEGKDFSINIDQRPYLHIAIKAEPGTNTCLFLLVHERKDDWKRRFVVIGKTRQGDSWCYPLNNPNPFKIKDDNRWHSYVVYLHEIREAIHDAGSIREIQFYTGTGSGTHAFYFNNLKTSDSYNIYREGVIKRHIVCSGRYLSGMWLKEFEPSIDSPDLLDYKRVFHPSFIRSARGEVVQSGDARTYIPWLSEQEVHGGGENPLLRGGIAMATFAIEYLVKGDPSSLKYAELLLDYFEKCEVKTISGNPTGFFLRCHHLNFEDEIELHASTDEIVGMVLGLYYLFLATEDRKPSTSNRVAELMQRLGNDLKRNAFLLVPPEDKVQRAHGDTDDPLVQELHRGSSGLFFFQWALEQAFQRVTGNRFTPNLSDYHHVSNRLWKLYELKHARSKDGPSLLVAKNRLYLAWSGGRSKRLFQLMSTADGVDWDPKDADPLKGERSDHSPSLAYFNGKFYIAWTGTDDDHHVNVMSSADGVAWCDKRTFGFAPPDDIYWIMYIWLKQDRVHPAKESNWNDAIQNKYHVDIWKSIVAIVFPRIGIFTRLAEDEFIESNKNSYKRYLTTIDLYTKATYWGSTENWFNLSLLRHTFHYALDEKIHIQTEARKVAAAASELTKVIIRGDRAGIDNPDDDFYAAVIAKWLLNRFANVNYRNRVNEAIETSRRMMCIELPAGELSNVREPPSRREDDQCKDDQHHRYDWHLAPVRFHNSSDLSSSSARIGTDFCWEKPKGIQRILASGGKTHQTVTGLDPCDILALLKTGRDVMYEAGGLDFMFPRVLMSYWLNEPLDFADPGVPPLRAITCLPFRSNGGLQKNICALTETSTNGPALATEGNQLLLGWVDTGNLNLNFLSSENGLVFSNKNTLEETSPDAPALTVFKNRFIVAWTGTGQGNLNIMQSEDGQTWTDKVTLRETSLSSPALAVFKDNIYIAWRGVRNNYLNIMRSSDGRMWQNKRTLNDTTTSGPALVEFRSKLLLAWRGVGNNFLNIIQSSNGSSFSNKVTLGETTTAKPYLHVHADLAYLAWQGVGNQLLNVIQSGNGTDWKHKITLNETCIDGPALGTLRNNLVWSWTGTDSLHRLNTLLLD